MTTGVHWFRRDLRIADNSSLHSAVKECDSVITVYIFEPELLQAPDRGAPRMGFLVECLQSLSKNLEAVGGRLILRSGSAATVLPGIVAETGATAVFWNRDYEPASRERDQEVTRRLEGRRVTVRTFKDSVLQEADEVLKEDGSPYIMFTPYARTWRTKRSAPVLPAVKLKPVARYPVSDGIPTVTSLGFHLGIPLPPAGERNGREMLKQFAAGPIRRYKSRRDIPLEEGTSRLSPHLSFGTVSPRTVYASAQKALEANPRDRGEIDTFVNELIWRDFYRQILWHFPHLAKGAFRPGYQDVRWENNEKNFQAWCEGRTGFPIVDAAMRQLNTTGWMHNRLRMITAMFLTKDLLVSWQWGERYFMQKLIDGDLAANNGGWQWSSSTGTDAQPYFRIFNPNRQAEKFDPEGGFIQHFVPEADLPGYPRPIVDHGVQRLKALALFKKT